MHKVPVSLPPSLWHTCPYSCSRHDPLYATFLLLGVLGTFKPYPTLSDPGLFVSLIALFPEIYPRAYVPIIIYPADIEWPSGR